MSTGTVSSANSTSLYSNTTSFTTGLVNSSVYSVNGGTGVTVNPTTGNVVVSIGQDVATTADVTFATANISDTTAINNAVINPLTITAVASGVTPTAGYGVGILAQATLTNGSLGSLGRLNWESGSVSSGDNDSTFNVYTYENNVEYKSAEINTNGAIFQSTVQLLGETSGYVALTAGFTPAGQTYTLPQAYPAVSGYVLVSTTGGAMSWVAASSLGGVNSITGTANQVIASSPTGAVTLSLPQDIATTSTPNFGGVTIDNRGTLDSNLLTTTSISTVAIDTTTRTGIKAVISIVDNVTTERHILEALLFKQGTNGLITTYAEMYTSAALATFSADVSAGALRLLATPASTNSTTFTVIRTSIQ